MAPQTGLPRPDYEGGSLINLVAELEWRLTGEAVAPRLRGPLAEAIPEADTYVLMVADGLGAGQLDHPAAAPLRAAMAGALDAPFPTTTSVSLSCLATGMPPARHGVLGYTILLPGHPRPVNTLKWVDSYGRTVPFDTGSLLPAPNLWERLGRAGVECFTVQPAEFAGTPLSRALYRGCEFWGVRDGGEAWWTVRRLCTRGRGRRLIMVYFHEADVAAHMFGQRSPEYGRAVRGVGAWWERMADGMPEGTALVATADHGHIDYRTERRHLISRSLVKGLQVFGDTRALYVKGPGELIAALGEGLPAVWHPVEDLIPLWGPSGGQARGVRPDGAFLADPGWVIVPGHMNKNLIGNHGGLHPAELRVPLLTAGG